MGLVSSLRSQLWKDVEHYPAAWPFSDRVLAWLLPSMKDHVAKFHIDHEKAMIDLFKEHQLSTIDEVLFRQLMQQIKSTAPVLLHWLMDVIRSIQDATQYPRKWH
jgi:hypothetical protein